MSARIPAPRTPGRAMRMSQRQRPDANGNRRMWAPQNTGGGGLGGPRGPGRRRRSARQPSDAPRLPRRSPRSRRSARRAGPYTCARQFQGGAG
eukprot:2346794-Pyramimonas_sp.AAC.1